MAQQKPVGTITRGTTNPNTLRRVDRWLAGPQGPRLRGAADPLVIDLGFGAALTTAVEMFTRMNAVRPDVEVIGIEIEPDRVRMAQSLELPRLSFRRGGFEIPVPGRRPSMVRAFNVLRQYDEKRVLGHWRTVCSRLAGTGLFIDGTCDEIGRRSSWLALAGSAPVSLTISLRFGSFTAPSDVAERLPKVLIHRTVPGQRIYTYLQALDRAWRLGAPLVSFGHRRRWTAACRQLRAAGWPIRDGPARWRLGEITVDRAAVAP